MTNQKMAGESTEEPHRATGLSIEALVAGGLLDDSPRRLHLELQLLRERAQRARRQEGNAEFSVEQIVLEAQRILPASTAGEPFRSRVHQWLGPYNRFTAPELDHDDEVLAVVRVMSEWVGEPADLTAWGLLVGGARFRASIQKFLDTKSELEAKRIQEIASEDSSTAPYREPTRLPCWQAGAAVLIGVSSYTEMPAVPSIANNISSLKELMTNGLGIPEEKVFAVDDPSTTAEVHEAIEKASEAADPAGGALFVYFAGHGWTDRGRLMLGLVNSSRSRAWSALDFNNLRIQIADSQISSRVVILDSCYSGAALDVLGADDLASAAAIDGTYVLTSANATTAALAPRGEQYTAFTGQLIAAFTDGIPEGPPVISADALYRYVERTARERGFPLPGRQIGGDGDRVEIMPNKWRG
ncbi:caspase family protein [Streptomyces sp. FXJ1.4098]|nr:caspase family protein [Streptomyces sp. FXJ1.4098]